MSDAPAGWYPDAESTVPQLRWWDGAKWTEHRSAPVATPIVAAASDGAQAQPGTETRRFRVTPGLIVCGVIFLLLAIISATELGFPGFLFSAGMIVSVTGAYAYLRNRPSWAQIPSRKAAGLIAGIGVIAILSGSLISGPVSGRQGTDAASSLAGGQSRLVEQTDSEEGLVERPEFDPSAVEEQELEQVLFAPPVVVDPAVPVVLATDALALIEVKERAPRTGFDRKAQFGAPWTDVDLNGCDTRNDILKRDLTDTVRSGSCKVRKGNLADLYTGTNIKFVRGNGTSQLVQIDHVVALSDAWQKGAQTLTPQQRLNFANDPLNLIAVQGESNSAKRDGDAATWLPKNTSFRCEYVARQISVKVAYALWVTPSEKAAMTRVLSKCPEQMAYTSAVATITPPEPVIAEPTPEPVPVPAPVPLVAQPAPAPEPAPAPAPEPAPAPAPSAYYKNCDAARAAGAAPVYVGQPGYGRHLDRDGDGVGCE